MFPNGDPARQRLAGVSRHGHWLPLLTIAALAVIASACSGSQLPAERGDYDLQNNEIRFDGQKYAFRWIGRDSQVHDARTDGIKLVHAESTLLRMGDDGPVLHLAENQPVQVEARDNRGHFVAPWYPFLWGGYGGRPYVGLPQDAGGNARAPSYRYPPSDSFGRDDTLAGSLPSTRPDPPDYARVPSARDAVAGQGGGTGGGAAATGRTSSPIGGQGGGVWTGSAASEKGGFRSGPASYSEGRSTSESRPGGRASSDSPRVGVGGAGTTGSTNPASGVSGARTSPARSASVSKGIGGARR